MPRIRRGSQTEPEKMPPAAKRRGRPPKSSAATAKSSVIPTTGQDSTAETQLKKMRTRRSSSRRTAPRKPFASTATAKSSRFPAYLGTPDARANSKEAKQIDGLFLTYVNKSGIIDPDGIMRFCSDVEVNYADVRMLMLAWKMQAEKQGFFTLEEWRRGLKALHADTISKIKKALPELMQEVTNPSGFSDFYIYSFNYCLTEEKQKTVDMETACELLEVVLGFLFRRQVDKLIEYLKSQQDCRVINMDQWKSFYRFCNEINFPSLDNYSLVSSWPTILDDFIEWMRGKIWEGNLPRGAGGSGQK